jgi:transketolase
MDINVFLYFKEMNTAKLGVNHPDRDIFFSSKGHDVPGLYAVFHALGILPDERLMGLRRLGGLDGHPDIHLPGCESNTGSLGMGISKGRGMARALRSLGRGGRVFVMTGDGEFQEGQIWEALQATANQGEDFTVIIDHNKLQTDMPVEEISSLGDLEGKLKAFGWHVERCNGHDFCALERVWNTLRKIEGPKIVIADTIKGRGVSFMEQIAAQPSAAGKYLWHSGAPADEPFAAGFQELCDRVNRQLSEGKVAPLNFVEVPAEPAGKLAITKEYVAAAYGEELVRLASIHASLTVLDCDLSADCRIRAFEEQFPERFIENGIAEQDMVSMAGGLAAQGLLPVCNSFSSFLCARANEQIYNNCCEGTKIIYAAHFSGMIPAGPGKSHQSVRDIGLLGSLPNMIIIQPCNPTEATLATRWAVEEAEASVCLRLNIGPCPRRIVLPADYSLEWGRGVVLRPGTDAFLIAYGPVMLHEALVAAEIAEGAGYSLGVMNMPWLLHFDLAWIKQAVGECRRIFTLDDHMLSGGFGERLLAAWSEKYPKSTTNFHRFGLRELPACGTPIEVLRHHGLDGSSLAEFILNQVGKALPAVRETAVFDTLEAAQ